MRRLLSVSAIVLLLSASVHPAFAADRDMDGDGIPDIREDADGNGSMDPGETDPFNADTDGGGESDGSEVAAKRNPLDKTDDMTFDADGDGWNNGVEALRGTDPKKADTDGDGVNDAQDPFPLNANSAKDANANDLPDEWEEQTGLAAATTAPKGAIEDADSDGVTNADEYAKGTDPLNADTDRDGKTDKDEIAAGTNPRESACLSFGTLAEPLSDMGKHWSATYVARLQRTLIQPEMNPIVGGYADGTFQPDKPVTRFEFLKMALLSTCTALNDNTIDVPVRFTDVLSIPQQHEDADTSLRRRVIYTAAHYGIVQGYPDGTFQADQPVNRAEALKMLALAAQLQLPPGASGATRTFSDVQADAWFRPTLDLAVAYDIASGYPDGTFRPGNAITRAESAKIAWQTMLINPLINGYVLPTE
ncbi:MAG TPA: S-layer homology domain-containing protein [Candidatus Peribacteria bacterium]|nr:S-layer homology domain-containing protein [Candidatus Peribacteria bacterium]